MSVSSYSDVSVLRVASAVFFAFFCTPTLVAYDCFDRRPVIGVVWAIGDRPYVQYGDQRLEISDQAAAIAERVATKVVASQVLRRGGQLMQEALGANPLAWQREWREGALGKGAGFVYEQLVGMGAYKACQSAIHPIFEQAFVESDAAIKRSRPGAPGDKARQVAISCAASWAASYAIRTAAKAVEAKFGVNPLVCPACLSDGTYGPIIKFFYEQALKIALQAALSYGIRGAAHQCLSTD